MLLYENGHDDYGKRDMTLKKLLGYIGEELLDSPSKDDMLSLLIMMNNGDLDAEIIQNKPMFDGDIEYTGIDPAYFAPQIDNVFNREVFVTGVIYGQRFASVEYDSSFNITAVHTRQYILNTKKVRFYLPYPLSIEDQGYILTAIS